MALVGATLSVPPLATTVERAPVVPAAVMVPADQLSVPATIRLPLPVTVPDVIVEGPAPVRVSEPVPVMVRLSWSRFMLTIETALPVRMVGWLVTDTEVSSVTQSEVAGAPTGVQLPPAVQLVLTAPVPCLQLEADTAAGVPTTAARARASGMRTKTAAKGTRTSRMTRRSPRGVRVGRSSGPAAVI